MDGEVGEERNDIPMLSASSREKPKRSETTQAHAIITGARFTTVDLSLSASSSRSSRKSNPPSAAAAPSSTAGSGKYSFTTTCDDDDRAAVPCLFLRFLCGDGDGDSGECDSGDDNDVADVGVRFFGCACTIVIASEIF